jgi:ribosomal protein S18 acetylase RimI-like enzyme
MKSKPLDVKIIQMSETNLKIRRGTAEDAQTLAPLAVKIFNDTFADNPLNKSEDMRDYIAEFMSLKAFGRELADENSVFFIAEAEGEMIGYAKLQEHSTEDCVSDKNPIELCRLYIAHEFHGTGIAKKLMDECFAEAKHKNYQTMWLGVWEFNFRAQKFYEKNGFYKVGKHIFQLGSDAQTDLVMEKKL